MLALAHVISYIGFCMLSANKYIASITINIATVDLCMGNDVCWHDMHDLADQPQVSPGLLKYTVIPQPYSLLPPPPYIQVTRKDLPRSAQQPRTTLILYGTRYEASLPN